MTAKDRPAPDDGPEPLTMTPRRLSSALDAIAAELARQAARLRRLDAFLPAGRLDREYESLRNLAEHLTDLGTSVLVGRTAIVEFRNERHTPERPLLDVIAAKRASEALVMLPTAEGVADQPSTAPPRRKRREKPPPANGTLAGDEWTDAHTSRLKDALDAVPPPEERPIDPCTLHGQPPLPEGHHRVFLVFDRSCKPARHLGEVAARDITRATMAAERRWPKLPRKSIDVRPHLDAQRHQVTRPAVPDEDLAAFRREFDADGATDQARVEARFPEPS